MNSGADIFGAASPTLPAVLGHEDAHSDGRMEGQFEGDGGLALVVSDEDEWTEALDSSSMRHWDTWSFLCIELLGGDATDLVKDRLLGGIAGNDHETAGVSFFFSDGITTAVWVGVWKGGQWLSIWEVRVAYEGARARVIRRRTGHGWQIIEERMKRRD